MKNKDKVKNTEKDEIEKVDDEVEKEISDDKNKQEELLNNKIKDLESALLRNQAELQNYKRRHDEECIQYFLKKFFKNGGFRYEYKCGNIGRR